MGPPDVSVEPASDPLSPSLCSSLTCAFVHVLSLSETKQIKQWGTIKIPEIDVSIFEKLIYDKDGVSTNGEKGGLFNN